MLVRRIKLSVDCVHDVSCVVLFSSQSLQRDQMLTVVYTVSKIGGVSLNCGIFQDKTKSDTV